jgi:predicted DNA-binding protein (UPF0251 family)
MDERFLQVKNYEIMFKINIDIKNREDYYIEQMSITGGPVPRPRINRWIRHQPLAHFYAPQGVPYGRLRGVTLTLDGLEALRLADAEGLEHEQAAGLMGISRPTFSRLLAEARAVVARALVNGWAIRIEGGNYEFTGDPPSGLPGRRRCRQGAGGGRMRAGRGISMSADGTGASAEKEALSAVEALTGPQAEPAAESPHKV